MYVNRLFQYIKYELIDKRFSNEMIDARQFIEKKDKAQNKLIIIPLTRGKNIAILSEDEKYQLKNHHISIYETQETTHPHLSEYHYTGYLVDGNGQDYQVHVFFNQEDQKATKAQFSVREKSEFIRVQISEQFAEVLFQLAITETYKIIGNLRHLSQKTILSLKTELEQTELEMKDLSVNLSKNQTAYLNLISKSEIIIAQLIRYHDDRFFYSLGRFLANLKLTLTTQGAEKILADTLEAEVTTPTSSTSEKTQKTSIAPKPKAEQSLYPLLKEAEENRSAYLKTLDNPEALLPNLVSDFLVFFDKTQKIFWLNEEKNIATFNELLSIREYMGECNQHGAQLLEKALLKNYFYTANLLKTFIEPLMEKMVRMSLATGNSEMLDFLLTHGELDIDTFCIIDNLTPVLFCLAKHSEKTNKTKCLSVLIKHKASLLGLTPDGLPAVHHAFISDNQSLAQCIKESLTSHQLLALYKAIVCIIDNRLDAKKLSAQEKQTLLNAIYFYASQDTTLTRYTSLIEKKVNERFLAEVAELKKTVQHEISPQLLNEIAKDPEIKNRYLKISLLQQQFFALLSDPERIAHKKKLAKQTHNLNRFLEMKIANTENLKQQTLTALDKTIENYNLMIHQIELRKIIARPPASPKMLSEQQAAQIEFKNNNQQIMANNEFLGFLEDEKLDLLQAQQQQHQEILQSGLRLEESLKHLKESISKIFEKVSLASLEIKSTTEQNPEPEQDPALEKDRAPKPT